MSEKKSEQPAQPNEVTSSRISKIFGPIRLLPGESEDLYNSGLVGTIKELGATTHLQTYLARSVSGDGQPWLGYQREKCCGTPFLEPAFRIG